MMKEQLVRLGFEIGSGKPVDIPMHHLAVTGQTQLSGKTTTLEALVSRSGFSAIAFVTKRGEGSFTGGRPVKPYFRDRADWQFVSSVLEATLREKMRFERAWIMRACKGAKSLADVQENVRELMAGAKGLNADVYMQLDSYLDIVVPQIDRLPYTDELELKPGINVMDLAAYTTELQALVIRSVIEWVYEEARSTLVIIPEAWEFIPQNRGSPVLLACESLIRKGGNLKNFVWLDSQDIAGVHKNILRSVGVWILGVQREANEVKRVLSHIPGNVKKPKVDDVMELERGQFFACFGKTVAKIYVQPAWMKAEEAIAVARGTGTIVSAPPARNPTLNEEADVKESEARKLREDNERLSGEVKALKKQIDDLQAKLAQAAHAPGAARSSATLAPAEMHSVDAIYEELKRRLLADPVVMRVLQEKPEIEVLVEKKTVQIDGSSLVGRVAQLLAKGFFDGGATNAGTRAELKRTGPDVNNANLARVLSQFVKDGFMTLESGDRFTAVKDMKVNVKRAA
jgi:hypothetical protein